MALGRATKLISHVQQMPKSYSATFELGKTSDTEDITGTVEQHDVVNPPTRAQVDAVCQQFIGEVMQLPPKYSALRVKGRRAHALARAGMDVKLEPRPIRIYELVVTNYHFPDLHMDVRCGSGTYIRSLGRDIGERLGCGAVMSALRRTQIGRFRVEKSVTTTDLTSKDQLEQHLYPLRDGTDLPIHQATAKQISDLRFGRNITIESAAAEIAAINGEGDLLAVVKGVGGNQYHPTINFIAQ